MMLFVYFISFLNSKKEISEVFDAEMIKSAKLISALVHHESFIDNYNKLDFVLKQKILNRYEYQIHAQAWRDNEIIFNSGENLNLPEPDYEGFRNLEINQNKWRSFVFIDQESNTKTLVLEKYSIRKSLRDEIIFSLVFPFFISLPFLFFIIFSVVKKELNSLRILTKQIGKISSENLKSFKSPNLPLELKPFLKSFNSLLIKLSDSMESEKRFTDYAAHELKTPLTAIKAQAQLLVHNKNPQKFSYYLDDLIKGVERANHLVEQLLMLSRIQSDYHEFNKEIFSLDQLLEKIVINFEEKISENEIKLQFFCEKNLSLNANRFYIEILINNLIDNAIKYSEIGGLIEIKLKQEERNLILSIINFGELIPENEIKKIFQNFYRINKKNYNKNISGSGLGLAICKKIVDLHSGLISFTSKENKNIAEIIFKS
jgi:signal transduction histidine kinase